MPPTTDDVREWVIEPPADQIERWVVGGVLVLVWGPLEFVLARLADGVTDEWSDLPLLLLLAVPLGCWSYLGFLGLREVVTGDSGRVITADRHGVRSERVTRRGRRRTAEVAWDDIRSARVTPSVLRVDGSRGVSFLSTSVAQERHEEIAHYITARVTPAEGRRRLPIVEGWTAYVDDRGPTLTRRRGGRRTAARWFAGFAGLLWVDTAVAAATDFDGLWGLVAVLAVAAAGLTAISIRFARTTPRWTAVPGAVVRVDNPGGPVTFRATAMELTAPNDPRQAGSRLLTAVDDRRFRAELVYGSTDSYALAEAGRWLADAAEIPFRDMRADPAQDHA